MNKKVPNNSGRYWNSRPFRIILVGDVLLSFVIALGLYVVYLGEAYPEVLQLRCP